MKKQHPCNNKQNKDPKPFQPAHTPNGDKGTKLKDKKTERHCNFCGKDGHLESKCLKKMEASEATIKKHNVNLDSHSSNSSSHGHALFGYGFSFTATSTSSSNEWLIGFGTSNHMAKNKDIFSTLNKCNIDPNYFENNMKA
jgi:hypothetical protein